MNYWLVKSEPSEYSWDTFVKENFTMWTGVRNFQARNFLLQMKQGDVFLFYHSGKNQAIVGVGEVEKEAVPEDINDSRWFAVGLKPSYALQKPITLLQIKSMKKFSEHPLVRQPRLSVMPFSKSLFETVIKKSNETK